MQYKENFMSNAARKDHPLSIRLPEADLALIDRASRLTGRSRTEFMREAAVRDAEDIILSRQMLRFTDKGFRAFMASLENPGEPVPELVEVLSRVAPWEKQ